MQSSQGGKRHGVFEKHTGKIFLSLSENERKSKFRQGFGHIGPRTVCKSHMDIILSVIRIQWSFSFSDNAQKEKLIQSVSSEKGL